jgi:hypothetical protein
MVVANDQEARWMTIISGRSSENGIHDTITETLQLPFSTAHCDHLQSYDTHFPSEMTILFDFGISAYAGDATHPTNIYLTVEIAGQRPRAARAGPC